LGIKLKPTAQILRTAWDEVTAKVDAVAGRPVYATP
jgi:hypothetical protein